MSFLGAFFVPGDRLGPHRFLPLSVVLLDGLGSGARGRETLALVFRLGSRPSLCGARLLERAFVRGTLDLAGDAERGTPRQIGHRKIALLEPLALRPRHLGEGSFEIALGPVALLGFSTRLLDLPQGSREGTRFLVHSFGANSLERVERILARHDPLMIARRAGGDQLATRGGAA